MNGKTQLLKELTLQLHLPSSGWQDCMKLKLDDPERGPAGAVEVHYLDDFATTETALENWGCRGLPAPWIQTPLEYATSYHFKQWPTFLMDLIPTGAAQRYWKDFLGLQGFPDYQVAAWMLQRGAIAPIGNLRIREAFESGQFDSQPTESFSWLQASQRMDDFVTHASQRGMMISGGSGAGGEAPKILLRMDRGQKTVWVDPHPNIENPDLFYLVKFPRRQEGNARPTQRDIEILKTEFAYYQELADLGVNTLDVTQMHLLEDKKTQPTLWLPRFDRQFHSTNDSWQLLGVESINAALGLRNAIRHEEVLQGLKILYDNRPEDFVEEFEELANEWVKRDLLSVLFGNTDNHGRNTSVLKTSRGIQLAPIYDFAPMAADESSIHRTIKWESSIEQGGSFHWHLLPEHLEQKELGHAETFRKTLISTLEASTGLYQRLLTRGVPAKFLKLPRLSLDTLDQRIQDWLRQLQE
ncbi:HipA domain-containing protein [Marinospirillum sp.]|uniref:HipA domain-containing protein n=1 Tax=Marinospirillum sp. TaxID=2183934 RepID=UPI00384CE129